MKPTLVTTHCFFLFGFTTYFPLPFTHAQPLYDVNGNYVLTTGRYVVLPDSYTNGGELMLGKTENAPCNLTILQNYDHVGDGLPLKLVPQKEEFEDIIFTDDHVDIKFENKPDCAESSKWVIVEADDDYPTPWIAVDGIQRYKKLKDGWFEIGLSVDDYDHPTKWQYIIWFCYTVSPDYADCDYVRRQNDENGMRLVIEGSGDVFGIVFKPADAATTGRSLV